MGPPLQSSRTQAEPGTGRRDGASPPATEKRTRFYGSQVGGKSVINYAYTDMPWILLIKDFQTFFTYLWAVPYIVWPLRPCDGADFDELYLSRGNIISIVTHAILVVLQLGFLLALPLTLLFPIWMVVIAMAVFFFINDLLCRTLNGSSLRYYSHPKYAAAQDKYAHEQWVFLNGVAVGQTWLQANIDRLAVTFKRPVQGIHNKTDGIIFDIFECLIQRSFNYATRDVREAYKVLQDHLYNPKLSKVVFIVHSQGGIQGSMILDWLLQELPQDLLSKLEVYTFGCAANHFNNPHRHMESQQVEKAHPKVLATVATNLTMATMTESPVERTPTLSRQPTAGSTATTTTFSTQPPTPTSLAGGSNDQNNNAPPTPPMGPVVVPASDRVLGHIEHYAHTTDFVSLWGVLHFVRGGRATLELPRFMGRVFCRADAAAGGHQFSQHYLNGMFPLERGDDGAWVGCRETNDFMESVVDDEDEDGEREGKGDGDGDGGIDAVAAARGAAAATAGGVVESTGEALREGIERCLNAMELVGQKWPVANREVEIHGSFHESMSERIKAGEVRVKHLSRLWQYRNGGSPPELPSGLAPGIDGVVRAGTL